MSSRPASATLPPTSARPVSRPTRRATDRAQAAAATLADPRWQAVLERDRRADGHFVYSVRSTGVYCRPSCGSRAPRPENVRFHATAADAEAAGFRACLRCRPDGADRAQRDAERIARLCRLIEQAETPPTLAELAHAAELSPWHLQRLFKAVTGVSPRAYADQVRATRLRAGLSAHMPVTDAIFGAGYNATARLYERADALLGMSPSQYRRGGHDADIRFAVGQCSLGAILVAESTRGICAISLGDDADTLVRELQDRFPNASLVGDDADFMTRVATIVGWVEAPATLPATWPPSLPLDIRGTAFQQRVWQALRALPPGRTVTYSELAAALGQPRAVRAVAHACAANTIAVMIPCHRVVRRDGQLAGYRWGVERKRALIAREQDA